MQARSRLAYGLIVLVCVWGVGTAVARAQVKESGRQSRASGQL
jgi:hypothetical protein